MIEIFVTLMKSNIDVGIVTAAGYPGEAAKFESRIQGLLAAFSKYKLPATITNRCVRRLALCAVPAAGFADTTVHVLISAYRLVKVVHVISRLCSCVVNQWLYSAADTSACCPH